MKHTRQDLKIMQGWSLERKIRVTQTRIMEWYMRYDGQVFISFSGGKDSTVLLDLARRVYPDIPAVYVDTGLEYPELRDFVKTKDNVIWLRPRYPFTQILEKYGYPIISKEVSDVINGARKGHLTVWHDSMENCWTRTERSRFTTARITNTFWTLPSRFRQGVVTT